MPSKKQGGASRHAAAIRGMILTGELLPGERLHQDSLAARLGVSRVPIREALSTLESAGIVEHRPGLGFAVARFNSLDLAEIYLMRRLLEDELLRSIDLAAVDVNELTRLNTELATVSIDEEREKFDWINEQFHFHLFRLSPLRRVIEEVARLWGLSTFYRSITWNGTDSHARVLADHDRIIEAARAQDLSLLLKACDDHRNGTVRLAEGRVSRIRPEPSL